MDILVTQRFNIVGPITRVIFTNQHDFTRYVDSLTSDVCDFLLTAKFHDVNIDNIKLIGPFIIDESIYREVRKE